MNQDLKQSKFTYFQKKMLASVILSEVSRAIEYNEDLSNPTFGYHYYDSMSYEHRCMTLFFFVKANIAENKFNKELPLFKDFEIVEDVICKAILTEVEREVTEEGCPWHTKYFLEYLQEVQESDDPMFDKDETEGDYPILKQLPQLIEQCNKNIKSEDCEVMSFSEEVMDNINLIFECFMEDERFFDSDVDDIYFLGADTNLSNIALMNIEPSQFNPRIPTYTKRDADRVLESIHDTITNDFEGINNE
jgi:hypothetical protein